MESTDVGSIARGYAEILCTDGAWALLRGHAVQEAASNVVERSYYAITEHDRVVYVRHESDLAWQRFNEVTRHRVDKLGNESAEQSRQDFLATQPTRLPTIRGPAYHKLAQQVSELSQGGVADRASDNQK